MRLATAKLNNIYRRLATSPSGAAKLLTAFAEKTLRVERSVPLVSIDDDEKPGHSGNRPHNPEFPQWRQ